MRYAVYLPNFGPFGDAQTLAWLARDAENAGWDGFFIWDHVAGERWPPDMADPWVALAAIALHTRRVRIGALVTPLPRRRPWKVARETVSVDRLSSGRLIFGAGTGDGPGEWDDLGEEADPAVRGAMLDEGLAVLDGLWSGEPFSYAGHHYRVRGAHFLPPPLQTPRIPVWVAGHWSDRAPLRRAPFRRAARWDGVFPGSWNPPPEDICAASEFVRTCRAEAGIDAAQPFDVAVAGMTASDRSEAQAALVPYAEAGVTWWLENISPSRTERGSWLGEWPIARLRARILAGPPEVGM
ncbi:MAG: LLM class flavin-dependent oxidoreductase [Anaerolineae bacterium]|nr:LLM class flavin-dependent oxidoreductase [Anaerolineae bacterium]